jgi:hypothetical protein
MLKLKFVQNTEIVLKDDFYDCFETELCSRTLQICDLQINHISLRIFDLRIEDLRKSFLEP